MSGVIVLPVTHISEVNYVVDANGDHVATCDLDGYSKQIALSLNAHDDLVAMVERLQWSHRAGDWLCRECLGLMDKGHNHECVVGDLLAKARGTAS